MVMRTCAVHEDDVQHEASSIHGPVHDFVGTCDFFEFFLHCPGTPPGKLVQMKYPAISQKEPNISTERNHLRHSHSIKCRCVDFCPVDPTLRRMCMVTQLAIIVTDTK